MVFQGRYKKRRFDTKHKGNGPESLKDNSGLVNVKNSWQFPKVMEYLRYHGGRWLRHYLSMPFIYMMIVPLIIIDIFLEVYHRICFLLYGLPYVIRSDYIRIDRHKLLYLNFMERINCAYCSYANGWTHYATAIAANTEKYWCGIKNDKYKGFHEPAHHKGFLEYGDEKGFEKFCKLRK
jgi:hypothetical protein